MNIFFVTGYDSFQLMFNLRTLFGGSNNSSNSLDMVDRGIAANSTGDSASVDDGRRGSRLFNFWLTSANRRTRFQQITEDCILCSLIIPLLFFFLVTLFTIVALYGSTVENLGPNVSKILDDSLVYVKDVANIDETADAVEGYAISFRSSDFPVLYGFHERPELNQGRDLSYERNYELMPLTYQKLRIWLNKGSKLELEYEVVKNELLYTLIVILQGKEALEAWTANPMDAKLPVSWHRVHGNGVIKYEVEIDAEYFVVLGNLNDHFVKVDLKSSFHLKLYNTESADISCSLHNDFCGMNLLYPGFKFALLTTPEAPLGSSEKWALKMVYGYRWIFFVISIGFMSTMIFLSLKIIGKVILLFFLHEQVEPAPSIENLREPLLAPHEALSTLSHHDNVPIGGNEKTEETLENQKKIYQSQLCVVCCNEPRSTFFHPCGHCVLCYTCSKRKLKEDYEVEACPRICSICGSQVKEVKRIFTV